MSYASLLSFALIAFGALVMALSILKFRKIQHVFKGFSFIQNYNEMKRFFRSHFVLMVFFFFGYLLVLNSLLFGVHFISELTVAAIFFFGALFVLIGVVLQMRMLVSVKESYDKAMDMNKQFTQEHGRLTEVNEQLKNEIRQREQSEKERKELQNELFHAQKMEAIGRLAGGVAHDFNNMLQAIRGYADLILMEFAEKDRELDKYIKKIIEASNRSAELVSKLLTFARKGKLEIQAVDLHSIIHNVNDLIRRTIDKRITIQNNLLAGCSAIMGDSTQLQSAILNLVTNAQDAMPGGGELIFSTDTVEIDNTFVRSRQFKIQPGAYLRLSVRDTGIGMDEETKARAFEPFFTTKEQGKGTGLGLSGVYGVVKAHGGFVEIQSEAGAGTTVEMYLPVSEEACRERADATDEIVRGSGRILLVDDEEMLLVTTSALLEALGYSVVTRNNGVEALDYFRGNGKSVDLVILDLVMPKMNGYDCFAGLKQIDPAVKVVICSGYSTDSDVDAMIDNGVVAAIKKPFNLKLLSRVIDKAMKAKAPAVLQ